MKKRAVAFLLTLAMVCSTPLTAFASTTNDGTTNTDITISGKYDNSTEKTDVISVGVEWGAMEFTYSATEHSTWDPSNHSYVTHNAGEWEAIGNNITLTNHSNVAITASLDFSSSSSSNELASIQGKFYNAQTEGTEITSLELVAPAEGSDLNSVQQTAYFRITEGTISQSYDNMGTITVSIAKKAE